MKQEKKDSNSNQKSKNQLNDYAKYSGMAFQMVAIMLAGVFGGIKLDALVTKIEFPVFTITFTLLAVVLAIYLSIKDFIK